MRSRLHSERSCSANGTRAPDASRRAGRRASVSSISASSPATSGSPGSRSCSRRVSRIASSASDTSVRPEPPSTVCPSVKTRYSTCATAATRAGSSAGGGSGERRVHLTQPGLRAADPLRHRRLRHQERPGDPVGAEAAHGPQRQRDLRGAGQRRVAAEEQQGQGVVALARYAPGSTSSATATSRRGPGPVGTAGVDQPPRADPDQPRAGVVGDALVRPLARRGQERLLDGVLAPVEVAVPPHERREDVRRGLPPHVLVRLTGRRRHPTWQGAARWCRPAARSGRRSPRRARGSRSRS